MKKSFIFFFFIIFLVQNTYGLGIAQEYIDNSTLKLYPGQERLFKLILQNPSDSSININLTVSGEIARIHNEQKVYTLPPKSYNNIVFLNITIPKNAKSGDTFDIRYSMTPITDFESNPSITMNMKISQPIHVLVIPEPAIEKEKTSLMDNKILVFFGFIFLVLVFWRLGSLINKRI